MTIHQDTSDPKTIKAVTVRQPEVTRLAAGEARIEVKTWRTEYRGELLLVSALTPRIEPAGYAIAVGRLVDCRTMTKADEADAGKKLYVRAQSWVLADVRPIKIFPVKIEPDVFDVPIPAFGIQPIAKVALTPPMDWSRKRPGTPNLSPPAVAEGASPADPRPVMPPPPEGTPLDILIVDADPLLARGVQRSVLSHHRVRSVTSCAAALNAVKERTPHVVICDFQVGTESSAPLLRAFACHYPQIRRVLYSSSRRDIWSRTIDEALLHGAVTKPATREQLLALIALP
jgi:hypothetical protein